MPHVVDLLGGVAIGRGAHHRRPLDVALAQLLQRVGVAGNGSGHAEADRELHHVRPGGRVVGGVPVDLGIVQRIVAGVVGRPAGQAGGLVRDVGRHAQARCDRRHEIRPQILGPVLEAKVGHGLLRLRRRGLVPHHLALCGADRIGAAIRQRHAGGVVLGRIHGAVVPQTVGHQDVEVLPAAQFQVQVTVPVGVAVIQDALAVLVELAHAVRGCLIGRIAARRGGKQPLVELLARVVDRRHVGELVHLGRAGGELVAVDVLPGDAHILIERGIGAGDRGDGRIDARAVIGVPDGEIGLLGCRQGHPFPVARGVQGAGIGDLAGHRIRRESRRGALVAVVAGAGDAAELGRGQVGRTARGDRTVGAVVLDAVVPGAGEARRGERRHSVALQRHLVGGVGVVVHAVHRQGARIGRRHARVDDRGALVGAAPACAVVGALVRHIGIGHGAGVVQGQHQIGRHRGGDVRRRRQQVDRAVGRGPALGRSRQQGEGRARQHAQQLPGKSLAHALMQCHVVALRECPRSCRSWSDRQRSRRSRPP